MFRPMGARGGLLCLGLSTWMMITAACPRPAPQRPRDGAWAPLPRGVVFFIREGDGQYLPYALVPLACFHPGQHRLAAGQTCASLLPPGAEVALAGGKRVKLTGKARTACDSWPQAPALGFSGDAEGGYYGVWPPDRLREVEAVPEAQRPLSAAEKDAVRVGVLSQLEMVRELSFPQVTEVVLERGARPTRIASAEASREGAKTTTFMALFRLAGKAELMLQEPVEPAAVDERLTVDNVMDLDGDGRRELLLEATGTDEHLAFIAEYGDGVLRRLSRWKNCAPP
jgi:hypothetical protein